MSTARRDRTRRIVCTHGGSIRGRLTNVPRGWAGNLWVVAFTETAIRAEARAGADGQFCFTKVAPGEYGLKVGHDAYADSDVPRGFPQPMAQADPWERATRVTVNPGRETAGVELEL